MPYVFTPEEELILTQLAIHEDMRPWLSSLDVKYKFGQEEIRGIEGILRSLAAASGGAGQTLDSMFPPTDFGDLIFSVDNAGSPEWAVLSCRNLYPSGSVLTLVNSLTGELGWVELPPSGMENPMIDQGQLIMGGVGGSPTALTAGAIGEVLTANGPGNAISWQAPSSGGYDFLTQNRGVFTIFDPTPVTGESQLIVREGADTTTYNPLIELRSNADSPVFQIGGINNEWNLQTQGSMFDWYAQHWYIGPGGMRVSANKSFEFTGTDNNVYATVDTKFIRSAAGIARIADAAGDPAGFDVGILYIEDGAGISLFQVRIDAAVGGK